MEKVSKTLLKTRRPKVLANRALFFLDATSDRVGWYVLHSASHREQMALEARMETKIMNSIPGVEERASVLRFDPPCFIT